MSFTPAYRRLGVDELRRRAQDARTRLAACTMCGHACGANRRLGAAGANCRTGARAVVASAGPHFGEERPLVGRHGSGTIFFSWCNLRCVFCQNADISHGGEGSEVTAEELAELMLEVAGYGCHNLNFVSPSHVVPQLLEALVLAVDAGLDLPLVYNSGGYDAVGTLKLLDGVVDIYMPDMKYADDSVALAYSKTPAYPQVNRAAVREMHRQVGDLVIDGDGVARRGLLVRHLVLPEDLAGTADIVRFLSAEISPDTYINIMAQYRPCHRAWAHPPLDRAPTREELEHALRIAAAAGLRLDWR